MARNRKLTTKYAGFPMFKVGTSGDTFPMTSPFTTEFTGLDGLALDLQFAADKTLTARKGPTPVFTRGSTGRFVGSNGLIQSAAINAPRFDHDPVTGVCKGLLIEESRTNSLIRSAELSNATSWTQVNVVGSALTAPDGTNTATSFNEGTASGEHSFYGAAGQNRPVMGAVSCTLSLFLQAGTRRYALLNASDFSNGAGMMIDTQNWVITDAKATGTGWTYTSSRLTNYGNGWYRAELTFTPPAATAVIPRFAGSNSSTFTALSQSYIGTNSTFIVWGAQLEAGSFATSYIPTATASVVRSADVCSITGSSFSGFYNASQGSLFANSFTPANGQRTIVAFDDNTANEMIRLRTEGTDPFYRVTDNGVDVVALDAGTIAANTSFRFSSAYAVNDFAATINGGTMSTSASGTLPTVDRMRIGAGQSGNTICGCIASVKYFKKRLANTKLQALT